MPKKLVYKPTSKILTEIAELFNLFTNSSGEAQSALGTSLLTASVRLLEGVVNTAIWNMRINEKLKEGLDRLQLVDKFDLSLYFRRQTQLDRSHHLVGNIIKMSKNRNDTTHPHILESEIEAISHDEETKAIHLRTSKYPYTPKIDEVLNSLRSTFNFLDVYLIDLCKCDSAFISMLLSEEVHYQNGAMGSLQAITLINSRKALESGLNITIQFLSYVSTIQQQDQASTITITS